MLSSISFLIGYFQINKLFRFLFQYFVGFWFPNQIEYFMLLIFTDFNYDKNLRFLGIYNHFIKFTYFLRLHYFDFQG